MASQKIVIIDPSLSGGICHYSFALCSALAAAGRRVSLVTKPGTYELKDIPRQFELVQILPLSPPGSSLAQKGIGRLKSKLRPDYWSRGLGERVGRYLQTADAQIVHQQWVTNLEHEPSFWESLRRRSRNRVPVVYTAHNVWPHESSPRSKAQYRVLYEQADQLVVHGEPLRQTMIQEAGIPERKIAVIPHGNYHYLAEAVPAVPRAEARARLGLPAEARVILFFGFVRTYKGLDVLLLAFERLLRQRTGVPYKLLVAGSVWGEAWEKSVYGGLCRSLKISENVQVEESYIPLEDCGLYFGAADVACFPYRNASQSGAVQLAYSYKKPAVVTSVGSLADAVLDGRTGALVPPEDPDALADALRSLLSDPARCRQMGEDAYAWTRDARSWEAIAQQTLRVYEALDMAPSTVSPAGPELVGRQ